MVDLATGGFVALLVGILVVLGVALRQRDVAAAVNAGLSLALATGPLVLEALAPWLLGADVALGAALPLWLAAVGFLHSLGMLGPYDSVPWWDIATHALAGGLVAALVYACLQALEVATPTAAVGAVAFTVVGGVLWELIELLAREIGERFDVEPVLVHYGWRDTWIDLVVDTLAAVLIVVLDVRVFVPIAEQSPAVTRALLLGASGVIVVASLILAPIVVHYAR